MNDKEKAEVMLAAHEGKQIEERAAGSRQPWLALETPHWNWIGYDYRVAPPGKPEPLQFWRNIFVDGMSEDYGHKEGATKAAEMELSELIRTAVHMREVVPVEPLEAGVWHHASRNCSVCKESPNAGQIVINIGKDMEATLQEDEIPALITALQGLMKGGEV